jgi:hypothetical protein
LFFENKEIKQEISILFFLARYIANVESFPPENRTPAFIGIRGYLFIIINSYLA